MENEYCGKYLGYRHLSGAKAVCGDDIGTRIIYCVRCHKKNKELTQRTSSGGKNDR